MLRTAFSVSVKTVDLRRGTMPWWELYFNELYLRMLETILTPDRTAQEVAGALGVLDLKPGVRILDLCCGQGRHAVPLAQAGYRMTGLDRSSYLLGKGQHAAQEAGVEVQWVRGDMRWLPWQSQFDPITCHLAMTLTWVGEGAKESLTHSVRQYTTPELAGMLRRAGLLPIAYYGDFDGSPFELYSKRLIILAQKPRDVRKERMGEK